MITYKVLSLTKLAWGVLVFNTLLTLLVSGETPILIALAYFGWLLFSFTLIFTWFAFHYHTFFKQWLGWTISVVLAVTILFLTVSNVLVLPEQLALFACALVFPVLWLMFLVTVILLWYRDVGLALLGWASIIHVWSLMLSWRYQGNLIELWLYSLNYPDAPFSLWWLNVSFCLGVCVFPVIIFSVIGHTFRLVMNELRHNDFDPQDVIG